MKKFLPVFLSVMLLMSSFLYVSAEGEKTTKAIKGTPKIDGVMDDIWKEANEVIVDTLNEGITPVTAKARTMWDEDFFYAIVFVKDSVLSAKHEEYPWERDSVEFYIDEDNAKASAYDSNDAQVIVDINNYAMGVNILSDILKSGVKTTPEGYCVEIAIPFRYITGEHGLQIGFDFGINDDVGDGVRQGVVGWNQEDSDAYANPAALGTVTLVTDNNTPVDEPEDDDDSSTNDDNESDKSESDKESASGINTIVLISAIAVVVVIAAVVAVIIVKKKRK